MEMDSKRASKVSLANDKSKQINLSNIISAYLMQYLNVTLTIKFTSKSLNYLQFLRMEQYVIDNKKVLGQCWHRCGSTAADSAGQASCQMNRTGITEIQGQLWPVYGTNSDLYTAQMPACSRCKMLVR